MYSSRKTTRRHGNTNFNILLFNVVATILLTWQFGKDYLIIFCASTTLHLIIETALAVSGFRKGAVYLYGRKLPRVGDLFLRAMVEGPGFCVPAFFVADQLMAGNILLGVAGAATVVGIISLYMGLADRHHLKKLPPGEEPLMSRRFMTRPEAVIFLAVVNTGALTALFMMPAPYRAHAFTYLIAYALLVMLFYLINYNLGVRMLEVLDPETGKYSKPGPLFQAVGLAYDSAYEMGLLISTCYWVTFYLGLFQYTTIG